MRRKSLPVIHQFALRGVSILRLCRLMCGEASPHRRDSFPDYFEAVPRTRAAQPP
ncbi:MAG: hypothetical protein MSG64_16040 [Pyrinomonadaceae bacterium MAG19_C2-C3]|nr:hypothetical protein [Pyrinomonadaceae bacterium MAG19_C2-C3]